MPNAYEIGRRMRQASQGLIKQRRVKAVMGRQLSGGTRTLRKQVNDSLLPDDRIFVQIGDNPNNTRVAINLRTDARAGLPCYIEQNEAGQWYVESVADDDAINFLGDHAAGANVPKKDVEASGGLVIPGSSFRPGALLPTSTSNLIFQVMPFHYQYLDSRKFWGNTTSIDLSSYLPATSGVWAWVWVAIDPKDNTITAKTSAEQSLSALLTDSVLTDMDMSGLIVSDAVKLQEGDTAYTASKHPIRYARDFSTGHSLITPTEIGTGLIGAGRALSLDGPITISGALTIKGIMKIA